MKEAKLLIKMITQIDGDTNNNIFEMLDPKVALTFLCTFSNRMKFLNYGIFKN